MSNSSVCRKQVKLLLIDLKCVVRCVICLDFPVMPVRVRCGHHFCRECMYKDFEKNSTVSCPVCKSITTKRALIDDSDFKLISQDVLNACETLEQNLGILKLKSVGTPPKRATQSTVSPNTPKKRPTIVSQQRSLKRFNGTTPTSSSATISDAEPVSEESTSSGPDVKIYNTFEQMVRTGDSGTINFIKATSPNDKAQGAAVASSSDEIFMPQDLYSGCHLSSQPSSHTKSDYLFCTPATVPVEAIEAEVEETSESEDRQPIYRQTRLAREKLSLQQKATVAYTRSRAEVRHKEVLRSEIVRHASQKRQLRPLTYSKSDLQRRQRQLRSSTPAKSHLQQSSSSKMKTGIDDATDFHAVDEAAVSLSEADDVSDNTLMSLGTNDDDYVPPQPLKTLTLKSPIHTKSRQRFPPPKEFQINDEKSISSESVSDDEIAITALVSTNNDPEDHIPLCYLQASTSGTSKLRSEPRNCLSLSSEDSDASQTSAEGHPSRFRRREKETPTKRKMVLRTSLGSVSSGSSVVLTRQENKPIPRVASSSSGCSTSSYQSISEFVRSDAIVKKLPSPDSDPENNSDCPSPLPETGAADVDLLMESTHFAPPTAVAPDCKTERFTLSKTSTSHSMNRLPTESDCESTTSTVSCFARFRRPDLHQRAIFQNRLSLLGSNVSPQTTACDVLTLQPPATAHARSRCLTVVQNDSDCASGLDHVRSKPLGTLPDIDAEGDVLPATLITTTTVGRSSTVPSCLRQPNRFPVNDHFHWEMCSSMLRSIETQTDESSFAPVDKHQEQPFADLDDYSSTDTCEVAFKVDPTTKLREVDYSASMLIRRQKKMTKIGKNGESASNSKGKKGLIESTTTALVSSAHQVASTSKHGDNRDEANTTHALLADNSSQHRLGTPDLKSINCQVVATSKLKIQATSVQKSQQVDKPIVKFIWQQNKMSNVGKNGEPVSNFDGKKRLIESSTTTFVSSAHQVASTSKHDAIRDESTTSPASLVANCGEVTTSGRTTWATSVQKSSSSIVVDLEVEQRNVFCERAANDNSQLSTNETETSSRQSDKRSTGRALILSSPKTSMRTQKVVRNFRFRRHVPVCEDPSDLADDRLHTSSRKYPENLTKSISQSGEPSVLYREKSGLDDGEGSQWSQPSPKSNPKKVNENESGQSSKRSTGKPSRSNISKNLKIDSDVEEMSSEDSVVPPSQPMQGSFLPSTNTKKFDYASPSANTSIASTTRSSLIVSRTSSRRTMKRGKEDILATREQTLSSVPVSRTADAGLKKKVSSVSNTEKIIPAERDVTNANHSATSVSQDHRLISVNSTKKKAATVRGLTSLSPADLGLDNIISGLSRPPIKNTNVSLQHPQLSPPDTPSGLPRSQSLPFLPESDGNSSDDLFDDDDDSEADDSEATICQPAESNSARLPLSSENLFSASLTALSGPATIDVQWVATESPLGKSCQGNNLDLRSSDRGQGSKRRKLNFDGGDSRVLPKEDMEDRERVWNAAHRDLVEVRRERLLGITPKTPLSHSSDSDGPEILLQTRSDSIDCQKLPESQESVPMDQYNSEKYRDEEKKVEQMKKQLESLKALHAEKPLKLNHSRRTNRRIVYSSEEDDC